MCAMERLIVLIAPPRVTLLDITGPWEVFCRAALYSPGTYRVVVASTSAELTVPTKFGLPITCHTSLFDVKEPIDTVLIAGSDEGVNGDPSTELLDWLTSTARRARRTGAVCTGAFYLARAGLLDQHRATTHWRYADRLQSSFDRVAVDATPIFIRDGKIWTSAGITAGIDLALAMVEEDCGVRVAHDVARDLVVFLQRHANQAQTSASLSIPPAAAHSIRELQRWVPDNLARVRTVEDLADFVSLSTRHFSRVFREETGLSPAAWLRALRVEAAERALLEGNSKQASVATNVGYTSTRSVRRLMRAGKAKRKALRP